MFLKYQYIMLPHFDVIFTHRLYTLEINCRISSIRRVPLFAAVGCRKGAVYNVSPNTNIRKDENFRVRYFYSVEISTPPLSRSRLSVARALRHFKQSGFSQMS